MGLLKLAVFGLLVLGAAGEGIATPARRTLLSKSAKKDMNTLKDVNNQAVAGLEPYPAPTAYAADKKAKTKLTKKQLKGQVTTAEGSLTTQQKSALFVVQQQQEQQQAQAKQQQALQQERREQQQLQNQQQKAQAEQAQKQQNAAAAAGPGGVPSA